MFDFSLFSFYFVCFFLFRFFELFFISSPDPVPCPDQPCSFSLRILVVVKIVFFQWLRFLESQTKFATRGLTCLHTRICPGQHIFPHQSGSSWSFCVVLQVGFGNSWTSQQDNWTSQQDGSSSPRPRAETWTAASVKVQETFVLEMAPPADRGVAV